MNILAINTATQRTAVALLKMRETQKKQKAQKMQMAPSTTQIIIEVEKSWPSDFNEAEKLLPQIKKILDRAKRDISVIFVVSGPGSFTGLRIGVTAANTIAMASGAKLIECDTFTFMKARLPVKFKKNTLIILRAGGENIAVQMPFVPGKTDKTINYKLIKINELPGLFKKNIKYVFVDIKEGEEEKYKLPKTIKWLRENELLTFGETVKAIIQDKKFAKSHRTFEKSCRALKKQHLADENINIVKPFYLQPPRITKSKKSIIVNKKTRKKKT